MKRIEIESSCIHSIGYNIDDMTLEIEFNSGGTYQYTGVPALVYARLINAPSIGKAYHSLIKGQYPHRKVNDLVFAAEIWRQIPIRVKMAVAASNPVGADDVGEYRAYLHFRVNVPSRPGFHKILVYLTGADDYTVKLVKIDVSTGRHEVVSEIDRVYCDQLGDIVEGLVWNQDVEVLPE